jgi:hypothetical protein
MEVKTVGVSIKAASGRLWGGNRKIEKNEKLKSSAHQGEFISEKNRHATNPTGAMDGNSGGCKGSEGMRNKDNWGGAGTKELNILPTKCKVFLFDMGISMASVFLSNELGELATKYQA